MNYRNFSPRILILAGLSVYLTFQVKVYVIISFLPPIMLWATLQRTKNISNQQLRIFTTVLSLALMVSLFAVGLAQLEEMDSRYAVDNLSRTSTTTRDWISYVTVLDGGSGYDLGEFSPTIGGMVSKFPQAVNVTLFRPYLWEAKKVIVFLTSLESLVLLFLTIKVIQKVGLKKIRETVAKDFTIQFCLIFSIVFAFSVGISSYNFGALSRYKIPCIPYFLLSLILIYYRNAKPDDRLLKIARV